MLKEVWRTLLRDRRRWLMVAGLITLGLLGPIFAQTLRSSVDRYLLSQSRALLSADVAVSATRPFRPDELTRVREVLRPTRESNHIEFISMAAGIQTSTLVQVCAIDEAYPIFGRFVFIDKKVRQPSELVSAKPKVWVFPEVLAQLDLKLGDSLRLGQTEFEISAVIEDGPGFDRFAMGLAPRLYIDYGEASGTGLLTTGSQIFYRHFLELPKGTSLAAATSKVKFALPDPDIFVRTPDDGAEGIERFFRFFSLYFNVLTMTVFALAWMITFYVVQAHFQTQLASSAILGVLGASTERLIFRLWLQVSAVCVGAAFFAFALVTTCFLFLPRSLLEKLPTGFDLTWSGGDLWRVVLLALFSSLIFVAPMAWRFLQTPLSRLLADAEEATVSSTSTLARLLPSVALSVVFVLLAKSLMGTWRESLYVSVGLLLSAVACHWIGRGAFAVLTKFWRHRPGLLRLALVGVSRGGSGQRLGFVAVFLAVLVLNVVPHLLQSVTAELEPAGSREFPTFFLFNIPNSELSELTETLKKSSVRFENVSPMLLGRLLKVNEKAPKDDRLARFPVRITYRDALFSSENLYAGRTWTERYESTSEFLPQISLEYRFADRNGFKLGDVMEFDIYGVRRIAQVTSLRKVRWSDFEPNFFIQFQPGVLDGAPQTFLGNVYVEPEKRTQLQYQLLKQFPDISILDIGRTLGRLSETVRGLLGPLAISGAVALSLTALLLAGLFSHNLSLRHAEFRLHRVLGAQLHRLTNLVLLESLLLSGLASLLAVLFGLAFAWLILRQLFELEFFMSWGTPLLSASAAIGLSLGLAWISSRRILRDP